ncbi:uncharacterized protein J3R85_003369, partial [Psidium guajava]
MTEDGECHNVEFGGIRRNVIEIEGINLGKDRPFDCSVLFLENATHHK